MRRAAALLIAIAALVPAGAPAAPGVLSRTEICLDDGSYAHLGDVVSLAGGNEVLVVVSGDGATEVRRFTAGGQPIGRLQLPAELQDAFSSIRLDRGPPGRMYATFDDRVFDVQLSQSVATIRRELFQTTFGSPFRAPKNVLAATVGQSFVIEANDIVALDTESGQPQYTGSTEYIDDLRNSGSLAITATKGFLAVAMSNDASLPDKIAYFSNDSNSKRIKYGFSIDVPGDLIDVSGGTAATWAATFNRGLYLLAFSGEQLAVVPELRGVVHVDQPADGTAWATRSDGLYHIGEGGGRVEKSAFKSGYPICGPARLKTSFAAQQDIPATGRIVLRVRPSEPVNARITGTLTAGRTYKLRGTTKQVDGGKRANLPLWFTRSALGALQRTLEAGGSAQISAHIVATDASGQASRVNKVLTLSR